MNRIVIVLAVVSLLGGCKKSSHNVGPTLARMSEFADMMCACKDKACADQVQEGMTKWATDLAAKGGAGEKLDAATVKKMTELGEKYAACMTTAMARNAKPKLPPPAPKQPTLPAAVASPATIDAVVTNARIWARGEHDQLHIVHLFVAYVGADGVVDPAHGKVTVELGRVSQRADDPKRRTGAPVTSAVSQPTRCTELSWTAQGWNRLTLEECRDAAAPFPRCTVPTIWKRAIDKGAPADALAVLSLSESTTRQWNFSIIDDLRKVAISYGFDDNCELMVEKP